MAFAEDSNTPFQHVNRFSIMTGLNQDLLLRGGNLAVQYTTRRFVFEYSHGFGLDLNALPSLALTESERHEGLRIHVPWTTGGGVGYRLTDALHLSLELKAHRYDVTDSQSGERASYTTYSFGPGVFYDVYLGKHLFLQPVLRWWPNIGSTRTGDSVKFTRPDGSIYTHKTHDWGVFFNANLGYTF